MVRVVYLVIVVQVEFPLEIGGYDLVGVAIDGEELTEIIAHHPAVAIPLFGMDPEADPRFRFGTLNKLLLSPPGAMLAGVGQPISAVDSD